MYKSLYLLICFLRLMFYCLTSAFLLKVKGGRMWEMRRLVPSSLENIEILRTKGRAWHINSVVQIN